MSEPEPSIIMQFKTLAGRIEDRTNNAITRARYQPQAMVQRIDGINIAASGGYGRNPSAEEVSAAEDMKKRLREEYRLRGENLRDQQLVEIADDIEATIAQLWALAPKVIAEAERIATELRKEAYGDAPAEEIDL